MQRFLLSLCMVSALALAGCAAKPKNGECKSGADCAAQTGYGKICVDGRCQECGQDSDCQAGFVCKANRCAPKPQCVADGECPAGQLCQNDRCVARPAGTCGSDRDCAEGNCQNGRCVVSKAEAASAAAPSGECSDASAFTIRFGFDQSTLTSDAQGALQKLAGCLKAAPAKRVTIQGNADERGTIQYNQALGSRRAESARKYLSDLGVAGTMDTVSFGKERPVCRESNEACWSQNRRDDFQIER